MTAAWSLDAGELIEADREPVGVWLREHGLDPSLVGYVEVDGTTVRAWLYEHDARGRRYLGADGKAATRVVTRHRHGRPPALQARRILRDRTDPPWPRS